MINWNTPMIFKFYIIIIHLIYNTQFFVFFVCLCVQSIEISSTRKTKTMAMQLLNDITPKCVLIHYKFH